MVDSTDQTKLLISTDEGANFTNIDLSDNTNSYKIQAGWLDGNDLWLVMCDNDGTADDFEVCFIELDDSNDCNPVAVSAGADNNTVYAYDIFKIGSNHYVINTEERAASGVPIIVVWDVDAAFVEKDTWTGVDCQTAGNTFNISPGVVVSQKAYFAIDFPECADIIMFWYDDAITTIVEGDDQNGYSAPSRTQQAMAYDGSNIFHFVVNKDADGLDYRAEYSITGDLISVQERYDIAFQLDRNNSATVPNELEKAFGTANEFVYEIKARRGGIIVLQDLSDALSGNIIAITDHYLFAINGASWDVFEYQESSSIIERIRIRDGILPRKKLCNIMIHPDNQGVYIRGDSLKIWDDNGELCYEGKIVDKNQDKKGLYHLDLEAYANEVFKATYDKTYSNDKTSEKLQDIVDNACNFCYRSSSITATTIQYDYVYMRALIYMFNLTRFLERQVPYIEPDGKVIVNDYDSLTATGKSWNLNTTTNKHTLVDIPDIEEGQQGYFVGDTGITRAVVRYINNTTTTKPAAATRDPIETLQGVIPLKEFRDPKLEASTEADQLATNLYNIFSATTEFIALRVQGEGWLQPGETVQIQNTGIITITQDNFLILSVIYDPKNDVYERIIFSDNIIFTSEFSSYMDTSPQQIHTASLQTSENQNNIATLVANGALKYVDRGDPAAYDYTQATLTQDNAYHDLDLTALTSATAVVVHVAGWVRDNNAAALMYLRENGNAQSPNSLICIIPSANGYNTFDGLVSMDSGQVIEYRFSEAFTNINLVIRGWFEPA
jgi:hypothetical protein